MLYCVRLSGADRCWDSDIVPNLGLQDASGHHAAVAQPGVDWGELFNGMVLPLANMSIRGALWYCIKGKTT